MIPCRDCDKVYFGESGRSWEVRLTEHKRDVKNYDTSNATFNHIIDNDHRINWNGAKLLYKANNYYIRRVVESSLINNYPNFNLSQGHFKFHKALQNCILKATGLLDIRYNLFIYCIEYVCMFLYICKLMYLCIYFIFYNRYY